MFTAPLLFLSATLTQEKKEKIIQTFGSDAWLYHSVSARPNLYIQVDHCSKIEEMILMEKQHLEKQVFIYVNTVKVARAIHEELCKQSCFFFKFYHFFSFFLLLNKIKL